MASFSAIAYVLLFKILFQSCAVQDDLKAQIILEQAEKMFRDGFAEISEGFAKVKTSITFSEADTNGNGLVEASELAEHFAVSEEARETRENKKLPCSI